VTDTAETKRPSITPGDLVRLTTQVRLRDTTGGDPVDIGPETTLMYLGMNSPTEMGDTLALVMGRDRILEVHPARIRRAD
jgi:hypothetical protein